MSIGKTISFGLIVEVVVISLFMTFLVALADLFPIAIVKTDLVGLLGTWLLILLMTAPLVYNLRQRRMENAEINIAAGAKENKRDGDKDKHDRN